MAGESLPDGEEAPPPGVRAMGMVRWALVALMAAASLSAWIYFLDAGSSFARSADQYRCPMHPSVLRERPGSCSICGMDLALVAHGTPQAQESPVPGLVPVEIPAQRTQLMGVRTAKVVPQRLAARQLLVIRLSLEEVGDQILRGLRMHRPIGDEQSSRSGIEKSAAKARGRFGACAGTGTGVAGRKHDPVGVKLEGEYLLHGQQSVPFGTRHRGR